MSTETQKPRKSRKIRTKLLLYIVPIVVIMIAALVGIAAQLSSKQMKKMASAQLESSVTNQGDNIESWMNENLTYFASVKNMIEKTTTDVVKSQDILNANYGFNKNAPDGLYIGTAGGKFYKAAKSEHKEIRPTETEWYKQGMTRVEMAYGPVYQDVHGNNLISATGILNDGSDEIKVIGADVNINKINVIVNSGVKMENASAILIDRNTSKIIAYRDTEKLFTDITATDSDPLLAGIAQSIENNDFETKNIGKYIVAFRKISGTDLVLASYIEQNVILSSVYELVNILIAIGVVAVLVIILLIVLVVNRVVAPIGDITKHIQSMSEGDFTIDVNIDSDDEIGVMGGRIQEFVKSMRGMLNSINDESNKLREDSDASDKVSKSMFDASTSQGEAMKQLNETVDQLANAVNDIAESATELATIVSDTKENGDKASESMKETVEISQKGIQDMQRLSSAMQEIKSSNENLVSSINEVGSASEEITNIVGMIREIAEETNLLSLNASIEAARAGEAGKGFAVVAQEIGKLANTSAASAQNISDLIEQVRKMIEGAVAQADQSAENINANSELIDVAVETFNTIYEDIVESDNRMQEMIKDVEKVDEVATNVAAISEEQAASAEEILATSNNMVEQAQNITKSSQDVADNSHELANTSETLTGYVQKFKI